MNAITYPTFARRPRKRKWPAGSRRVATSGDRDSVDVKEMGEVRPALSCQRRSSPEAGSPPMQSWTYA
jgi:hypothetical protein